MQPDQHRLRPVKTELHTSMEQLSSTQLHPKYRFNGTARSLTIRTDFVVGAFDKIELSLDDRWQTARDLKDKGEVPHRLCSSCWNGERCSV